MDQRTKCPHCGAKYRVVDPSPGQTTTCTKCGVPFAVSPPAKALAVGAGVASSGESALAVAAPPAVTTAAPAVPARRTLEPAHSRTPGTVREHGRRAERNLGGDLAAPLPATFPASALSMTCGLPNLLAASSSTGPSQTERLLARLLIGSMALNAILALGALGALLLVCGPPAFVVSTPGAAPTRMAALPLAEPTREAPPAPTSFPAPAGAPISRQPEPTTAATLPAASPAPAPTPETSFRLLGSGSSFVNPLMQQWIAAYPPASGSVTYMSTGSGKGVESLLSGASHFCCSDAPLSAAQREAALQAHGEVLHVPLAMGAVVAAYNLPGTPQLKFTGGLLADIYLGQVKQWNDPAIAALNPGTRLPDQPIVVVHRSDKSGTTYLWTDYLSKVSPAWKASPGTGTEIVWPVGEGRAQNEGVANYVRRTDGAISYVELNFALANKLQFGLIQNKAGAFIEPSLQSTTAAAGGLQQIPEDLCFSLTDSEGPDAYPVCGAVWAIFYVAQPADAGDALLPFVRWATHEGQTQCRNLNYAPLPASLVERIDKKLALVQIHR